MLVPRQPEHPGAIDTAGYDKITSITAGESDKQVVVEFGEVYAPYKDLFRNLIKADVFAELRGRLGRPGRRSCRSRRCPYKIESWSLDQSVLVPNENYYGENAPTAERIVMVPKADQDTEVASLLSGEIDFIFPQAFAGLTDALDGPEHLLHAGLRHELRGAALPAVRGPARRRRLPARRSPSRSTAASSWPTIYDPIFPGGPLLNCGALGPDDRTVVRPDRRSATPDGTDAFYDPAGAEEILTDAGWEKNGDGLWAKDGVGADPPLDGQLRQHPP